MTPPENEPDRRIPSVPNPDALTMQDAILALQRFWTDRGALVVQPFNTEVGAGTGNPATALRVLGPEPWRVGYVEPSVRPDDARYGENPNRLQTHTQFQVILKPDPGNPQELYLESLRVLGIDLDAHDVRFVEDNWASPALGAWGLGWEVWLDGMEITQFTYFQQAGGIVLKPVSVEITYGLERILMALQGVQHVMDIAYARSSAEDGQPGAAISYGEVFRQSEYEMSRYYLDDADVATNRTLFEAYAAEAARMVELELPVPAYSYVLKASHAFNVLDARGAISTTERASSFKIMRNLTRDAATLWVSRREALGFPLGEVEPPAPAPAPTELPTISEPATVLFEIGLEELPWTDVLGVGETSRAALAAKLAGTRLPHGDVRLDGTPRRLIFTISDVAPAEPDIEEFKRGPKRAAAFDADGNPTKAAAGFCRGQGVEVAALETVEVGGIEYVGVTKAVTGRTAAQVFSSALAEIVAELRSERNMRWADPSLTFSRPIRWLLALIGNQPLPVVVSALSSGTTTRVLRTAAEAEVEVSSAEDYLAFLSGHDIVADRDRRRTMIVDGARTLAEQAGGTVDLEAQAALVEEITDLVEAPNALLGSFEERYMSLPASVLTTVMRKHQRYLAVTSADGSLLPHFITVANGDCDVDLVRRGNEAVLRARYEDASFFFAADQETTPEEFHGRLEALNFETRLGTVADRAARIAELSGVLADELGVEGEDRRTIARAGALAKFDLATQMVVELSSLAGVMAQEYARRSGETAAVATALSEMELPRSAGAALPGTLPGAVLSLADRFDLLTGMMAIGNVPTGSSDPFGVRRAATGIVNVLRGTPELASVSISAGVAAAAQPLMRQLAGQDVEVPEDLVEASVGVALRRYELQLLDAGNDHRHVQAVLPKADLPAAADRDLDELNRRAGDEDVQKLIEAVLRVIRILPAEVPKVSDTVSLTGETEVALTETITTMEDTLGDEPASLADFIAAAKGLPERVDAFFEAVLVMDPDPNVRDARLALLRRLATLADRVLDWSAL